MLGYEIELSSITTKVSERPITWPISYGTWSPAWRIVSLKIFRYHTTTGKQRYTTECHSLFRLSWAILWTKQNGGIRQARRAVSNENWWNGAIAKGRSRMLTQPPRLAQLPHYPHQVHHPSASQSRIHILPLNSAPRRFCQRWMVFYPSLWKALAQRHERFWSLLQSYAELSHLCESVKKISTSKTMANICSMQNYFCNGSLYGSKVI